MKKIFFDLIGVITQEGKFATKTLYPFFESKLSYDLFKKRYLLYCIGHISHREFWEDLLPAHEIVKFEQELFGERVMYDKEVVSLIKRLHAEGQALYLATEIPHRWGELVLRAVGLKKCFKKKIYSSVVGHTKPFSSFYKKVFYSRYKKGTWVYIDDTEVNLLAAKKMVPSLVTILYNAKQTNHKLDFVVKRGKVLKQILYEILSS